MAKATKRKSSKPTMVSGQERDRIAAHQALMRCSRREVAIQRLTRSLKRSIGRSDDGLRELHNDLAVRFDAPAVLEGIDRASNG